MEWKNKHTASPTVIALTFRDDTGFDPDPMVQLYADLGTQRAHQRVVETLTEISHVLANLAPGQHHLGLGTLTELLATLITRAEELGMHGLCCVARAVERCIAAQDETAQAATLARLMRIGDRAVAEIWQLTRDGS